MPVIANDPIRLLLHKAAKRPSLLMKSNRLSKPALAIILLAWAADFASLLIIGLEKLKTNPARHRGNVHTRLALEKEVFTHKC